MDIVKKARQYDFDLSWIHTFRRVLLLSRTSDISEPSSDDKVPRFETIPCIKIKINIPAQHLQFGMLYINTTTKG